MFAWLINPFSDEWNGVYRGIVHPPELVTRINKFLEPGSDQGATRRGKAIAALAVYQFIYHHWPTEIVSPLLSAHVRSLRGITFSEWEDRRVNEALCGFFVVGTDLAMATEPNFLSPAMDFETARADAAALSWRSNFEKRMAWAKVTTGVRDRYIPDFSSPKNSPSRNPHVTVYSPLQIIRTRQLYGNDIRLLGWG